VPTDVPPHEPLYHFQLPPVPKLPPFNVSVTDSPLQMVEAVPVTTVAGTEVSRTVMVTLWQAVLLHVPSAFTKYVVVDVGVTLKLLPLPTGVPVQLPLYHSHVAPVPNEPPFLDSVVL
jgi:hypothetical protein